MRPAAVPSCGKLLSPAETPPARRWRCDSTRCPRGTGEHPAPPPSLLGLVVRGFVVRRRTAETVLVALVGEAAAAAARRELTGRREGAGARAPGGGGRWRPGLAAAGPGGSRWRPSIAPRLAPAPTPGSPRLKTGVRGPGRGSGGRGGRGVPVGVCPVCHSGRRRPPSAQNGTSDPCPAGGGGPSVRPRGRAVL